MCVVIIKLIAKPIHQKHMARLPRITPVGIPVHIIQRGNNRQACFVSEEDHVAYMDWLQEYSLKQVTRITPTPPHNTGSDQAITLNCGLVL